MAEGKSYLDQLSPREVFQLLAKAAETHKGLYLENLRIVIPDVTPFRFVTLEVPDPVEDLEKKSPEEYREVFKTLVEAFKEMTGRAELYRFPGGRSVPLMEGMAWLLSKSAAGDDEHIAASTANEYIVVSKHIDQQEAEVLFKNLNFHATSTRVTSVTASSASGSAQNRYLFHIKDDPRRKSSFQSLSTGGVLKDCVILKGFESEDKITFLPPDTTPGEQTMKYFRRLEDQAPLLFSRRESSEDGAHLLTAAVVEWQEPAELEFWYLGGLRFFGAEQFTARKVETARFQYLDLEESVKNLEALAGAISKSKPYVGYRLELRTTTQLDKNDLQRLNEQKARIDYNIAYLQSISRPRLMLMRFNQKQLPVLAAEIRSFPIHVILDGNIKYGFQATRPEPGGYHYLLINPAEAARMELDPFPLWRDLNVPHMRFRLDPFWANHYFDSRGPGEALVFVPEGCTIHPPLHAWDRASMDDYLRETMSKWFKDSLKGIAIPARPIYIFEGKPGLKAPITISVIDRDRMEPLHTRLGWLNDNLVIHKAIEKESFIQEMARDINWMQMAEKIKVLAERRRQEFEETAREAAEHMAGTTAEMTSVLTGELNKVVRDSFRMVEKIRKLTRRLEEWEEVTSDMEQTLKEVNQQKQATLHQKSEKRDEFWRMEHEIQRELIMAAERRKEMEESLEVEIKKMQLTNHKLKQRLKSFKL
jgi:hypothetical protein